MHDDDGAADMMPDDPCRDAGVDNVVGVDDGDDDDDAADRMTEGGGEIREGAACAQGSEAYDSNDDD